MSMTRGRGRSRSRKFQKWAAPATLVPIPGSVAEPELFLAAPAPALAVWILDPGADSGSDKIGSAPALGYSQIKNQLRLHPKSSGSATLDLTEPQLTNLM